MPAGEWRGTAESSSRVDLLVADLVKRLFECYRELTLRGRMREVERKKRCRGKRKSCIARAA